MNFAVSCKAFIVDNGKLLIIKRRLDDVHKPGVWEIPGGRLEFGEDPYKGIKREVQEEVGLEIEVHQPLNVKHYVREDQQTITMLVFLCKPINKQVKLSEEHVAFEWFEAKQAKERLNSFFHGEIDNYLQFYQEKI